MNKHRFALLTGKDPGSLHADLLRTGGGSNLFHVHSFPCIHGILLSLIPGATIPLVTCGGTVVRTRGAGLCHDMEDGAHHAPAYRLDQG